MSKAKADEGQGTLAIEIPESAMALEIQYIPWDLIFPDPDQPRVEADSELKASIAAGGIRQAITVRPRPGAIGQYQIVDGERRWRGAQEVQTRIPCVVRLDMDDDFERVRAQLITNTGKPLTPVEEARAMAALMAARNCSITELAQQLGKPVTTVSQRLNLMQLGPWLDLIQRGLIKYTHAAEVLLRYRGCPDAVHDAVIAGIRDELDQKYPEDESAFESSEGFEFAVEPLYKKHLYPITKKKHDVKPIFETALHDRECSCGGIELKEWDGKRRYCGNPEWWGPREKAAKKEERAKAKAAAEKSGKKSGGSATTPGTAEPSWQREQRERREFAERIRQEADAIYKAFAGVIKKASTKPGGALDTWLRKHDCGVPSKAAEKFVSRGVDGDGYMRWIGFGALHWLVSENEYRLEQELQEFGKAFGVDVAPFIKRAKAAPEPVPAPAPKAAVATSGAKKPAKRDPNAAYMTPVTPNEKLAAVVGAKPLPRIELTKKLWAYIQKHGLQDKKNKRMINADEKLKPIFGGKAQVSMFDVTKIVSKHLVQESAA